MTHDGQRRSADVGTILTLPKMRKTSLSLTLVEVAHSIVLMLWVGSLAGFALIVLPSLPSSLPTQELAVRATLAMLERTAFLGCGAGAFLLLTTLLMHLLSLRRTSAILTQMSLILMMAISSILSQVLLAPRVNELLNQLPAPLAALGVLDRQDDSIVAPEVFGLLARNICAEEDLVPMGDHPHDRDLRSAVRIGRPDMGHGVGAEQHLRLR